MTPELAKVRAAETSAEPLKDREPVASPVQERVLAVAKLLAVLALPVREALIVAGSFKVTLPEPLTETAAPVLVAELSAI